MSRRLTHDEFIKRLAKINSRVTVLENYIDMNTKIKCACENGHIWYSKPKNLMLGRGCKQCAIAQGKYHNAKSQEQFIKEVHNLNPDITVIGRYVNAYTKIEFMCSMGHKWKTMPSNILDGCSCPICKGEKISKLLTKSHEQFLMELVEVNPDVTILSEYKKGSEKVLCRCNKDNHEWWVTPNNLLHGFGCPKCNQSKGEKTIENYLIDNKIVYETQKRFDDCKDKKPLPFDFYLPDYNLCIEYQGEQHYKPTRRMGDEVKFIYRQKHDCIKREYCKIKGINLLEIPYTEFNKISEILKNEVKEVA